MDLKEISVRLILDNELLAFQELMQEHHYLGLMPSIGETLRYVALWRGQWIGLLNFSSASLKCGARDDWIGWGYRHKFNRLSLVTNNSRFLILPEWHLPNIATKILSLCQKRISTDWQKHFKHPLLMLETYVDPKRFQGTVYKAANWIMLGKTKGYSKKGPKYQANNSPKLVFVYPLKCNARQILGRTQLNPIYHYGETKLMITVQQMTTLSDIFKNINDPRRAQGRRHRLSTILGISAAAILCGRQGYKGIYKWAKSLSQKARSKFRCRYRNGKYLVPSEFVIRDLLIRVDPQELDLALMKWNSLYAIEDTSLAIDGKTMHNAKDDKNRQTQIMSVTGHKSLTCYTQKKSVKSYQERN